MSATMTEPVIQPLNLSDWDREELETAIQDMHRVEMERIAKSESYFSAGVGGKYELDRMREADTVLKTLYRRFDQGKERIEALESRLAYASRCRILGVPQ